MTCAVMFHVERCEFRVPGSGFRVPGSGFRVSCAGKRMGWRIDEWRGAKNINPIPSCPERTPHTNPGCDPGNVNAPNNRVMQGTT